MLMNALRFLLLGIVLHCTASANNPPTTWMFVDSSTSAPLNSTATVRTSIADYDDSWIARHFYIKRPGRNWEGYSFQGVTGDPRGSGGACEWDRLWSIPLDIPGVWEFKLDGYDFGSGVQRWCAPIYVSILVQSPINTAPKTTALTTTGPVAANQPITFVGFGEDEESNLQSFAFYVNGPGFPGWNFVGSAPAERSGKHASARLNWTPPAAGEYAVHIRAWDTMGVVDSNGNVLTGFSVSSGYAFKILISTNTYGGMPPDGSGIDARVHSELNALQDGRLSLLAADGAWTVTSGYTSPYISPNDWPKILKTFGSDRLLVTEDVTTNVVNAGGEIPRAKTYAGKNPDFTMIYAESGDRGDLSFLDTILSANEITNFQNMVISRGQTNSARSIVVLARNYHWGEIFPNLAALFPGGISYDANYPPSGSKRIGAIDYPYMLNAQGQFRFEVYRGYHLDAALSRPECAGVVFEIASTDRDALGWGNVLSGMAKAIRDGKKCFLLMNAVNGMQYSQAIEYTATYLASVEKGRLCLNDPDFHIVLATYDRRFGAKTGFFQSSDGSPEDSIHAALQRLKAFRSTGR